MEKDDDFGMTFDFKGSSDEATKAEFREIKKLLKRDAPTVSVSPWLEKGLSISAQH